MTKQIKVFESGVTGFAINKDADKALEFDAKYSYTLAEGTLTIEDTNAGGGGSERHRNGQDRNDLRPHGQHHPRRSGDHAHEIHADVSADNKYASIF